MSGPESSGSEVELPRCKEMPYSRLSAHNRISSRQSEKSQKLWAVVDFTADHSLLTVPSTWVRTIKSNEAGTKKIRTKCFWPKKGSDDELRIRRLIKVCSDPDVNNWDLLEGVFKGYFKSLREADSYITEKLGTVTTSSCTVSDSEKNAGILEEKGALLVRKRNLEKRKEKHGTARPRLLNNMVSRSPAPNVPRTPTSTSQTVHNPGPSTSYSIPVVQSQGNKGWSLPSTVKRKIDGRYKTDRYPCTGTVTPTPAARKLYENTQEEFPLLEAKLPRYEGMEDQVSRKKENTQEQLLQALLLDIKELKEDVRHIKNALKCGANKTVETTVENPFEILRSFGCRANSVEELLELEDQFSEKHQDGEKNRATLLKVLMELAPKPKHGSKISALDIIRVSMQRLAGDWLWQYICATGRSGKKISMRSNMPCIMDIILLTACKTLSIDPKEATTALSIYLKNTSTRVSAKKYREKLGVDGQQNVQPSASVSSGRDQAATVHKEGRLIDDDSLNSDDSSGSEESSLARQQEISDCSDTQ